MSNFIPGLVSITFRKLSPLEIVQLVSKAGLNAIEWGGDVHAPHSDVARAAEIRAITEGAGLQTAAYGSYYRVGVNEPSVAFEKVLDSAVALGAPVIRVWAGNRDSKDADEAYVDQVAQDGRRIAELAAAAGIAIGFEYHGGTIADNAAASLKLIEKIGHPNVKTLWQPSVGVASADRAAALAEVMPHLSHVHVFQWRIHDRLPLSEGATEWSSYLDILKPRVEPTPLLIEFVTGDEPEAFLADAATLKAWIEAIVG